jgi:hypothetical protein
MAPLIRFTRGIGSVGSWLMVVAAATRGGLVNTPEFEGTGTTSSHQTRCKYIPVSSAFSSMKKTVCRLDVIPITRTLAVILKRKAIHLS